MNSRTIKEFPEDTGTLVPEKDNLDGTMIAHVDCGTLVPDGTMVELESNLGTMVINSDSEDSTMKSKWHTETFSMNLIPFFLFGAEHDTNPDKPKYRPPFLDHFDRKKTEAVNNLINMDAETNSNAIKPLNGTPSPSAPPEQPVQSNEERQRYQSHLQLQLNQISAANQMGVQHLMHHGAGDNVILHQRQQDPVNKYQRNFVDGDFEFVRNTHVHFAIFDAKNHFLFVNFTVKIFEF